MASEILVSLDFGLGIGDLGLTIQLSNSYPGPVTSEKKTKLGLCIRISSSMIMRHNETDFLFYHIYVSGFPGW